jgi:uncharacterized protein YndB with AHSA1/START domain
MGRSLSLDLDRDPRAIVATRLFDAPRPLVWAAWSDPLHLGQWWGPMGFTTTTTAFDMRPGGTWLFVMHGPDGRDYPNRITYEEIVVPERLVYRHTDDEGFEPVRFKVTVTFEDVGGRTRLTMVMDFPSAEERNRVIGDYGADKGLVETLTRLAEHLTAMAAASASHWEPVRTYAATVTVTEPGDREVRVSRRFDAPRRLVFEAFTRPEMVKRWLYGPEEWPLVHCEIDPRVGGAIRYVWRHRERGDMGMSGVFREVATPARLVHTEIFDEDWTGGETVVTAEFAQKGERTTFSSTVLYSSTAARDAALETGMIEGWARALARLADLLPTMVP